MVEQLGRLKRLDPRSVWRNEATEFTPWLQQNIDLLAAAVGMDIQLVEREVAVGDFSVDLVGEEPGSSRPVIIENQLEPTDHRHLGQLLTYAAGKDGGVIIWVARQIRPEHQNALEWLNNATQGNIDFFGVELELVQIEGSPMKAPNFKVVVAPRATAPPTRAPQTVEASERNQRHQAFFQDWLDAIKERRPGITRARRAYPKAWIDTPSGRGGIKFSLSFPSQSRFRTELYIDTGSQELNKHIYDHILANKEAIEDELGVELSWERLENRRASRIAWYWNKPVTIMDSPEKLQELTAWAIDSYFKFRDTLSPYLQNLPPLLGMDSTTEAEIPQ